MNGLAIVLANAGFFYPVYWLSMFLVRAYEDQPGGGRRRFVSIDRLEEKLGQHASTTATLTFDAAPAELVGEPGRGFRQMLEIMNHARLGVGFESIGLCEAAVHSSVFRSPSLLSGALLRLAGSLVEWVSARIPRNLLVGTGLSLRSSRSPTISTPESASTS